MGKRLYLSSSQRLRPEQAATPGRLPRGAPRQLPSRYARPPIWLRSATGPGEGRPPQLRRKGVRNKPIGLGALELTATSKGARASAHRHGPGPASAFSHAASFPFPCGSGALPAPGQASRLPSESPAATGSRSRSPRAAAAPPPSGRPACPDPSGAGAGRRAARQEGGRRRAGRGRPVPRHRLPPAPQEAEGAAGSSCSGGVSSAPCPAPPAASVLPRVLPPLPPHSSPSSCWLGLRLRLGFPRSLEPPNMNGVVCAQRHQAFRRRRIQVDKYRKSKSQTNSKMIPNGYLMFEDENFIESSVAKLNALRKSGQFCDVRLQVCGHEMLAHRAVLACCSPYLFEIFNSDSDSHGISHVKFDDLNPDAVEVLLNYAYTAQLKADKELVKDVYSAAKKLKMERVKQVCGDYLLSKMDVQSCISYRNFGSSMGDSRLLNKIDGYIQEHLLQISEQEEFLKLPRLKLEVMLEDNVGLPSNGKLYTKVINWVQRSIWENGDSLEDLMEEVQTLYYSADHKLLDGNLLDGQAEVYGSDDDHIQFVQKKPPRENDHKQISSSSSGSLSPSATVQSPKHEWKIIASEKTSSNTYLCLAVLDGVLCVIFLHGRNSPQSSPTSTPRLLKSLSFELQPNDVIEKPMSPMQYARSGLGTAELNGKLIAAGGYNREECLRTVECYDPQKDAWTFIAPMRTPRARFQMAVLMGQLYVVGGSNGHSDDLSCGEMYEPEIDDWTPVPELRTNRCNAGVCALNGKLYIVGGSDPYGQKGLKNCDVFDPLTKSWTSCAPLNVRRHQSAVCELGGYLYIIGGAESWNCLSSVERYNPENDTWTLIAPMNMARRGAGVAVHDGKLFVGGGFDGSHAVSCVEMYDPAKNEWKMMGNMTTPRSNAGITTVANTIYAVGGFDGNEFLNTIEVYNPETNEWSPYTKIYKF